MKTFFSKLWWVFKPFNVWHVAVYAVLIGLTINTAYTRPPSKEITDFSKVEGILTDLTHNKLKTRIGTAYIAPFGNKKSLRLSMGRIKSYGPWLNKPVVAYYWPAHGFGGSDRLVLMAPLAEEKAYLNDFIQNRNGFENITYLDVSHNGLTGVAFFFIWAIPFCFKWTKVIEEKQKIDKLKERLEIEKKYEMEQRKKM